MAPSMSEFFVPEGRGGGVVLQTSSPFKGLIEGEGLKLRLLGFRFRV